MEPAHDPKGTEKKNQEKTNPSMKTPGHRAIPRTSSSGQETVYNLSTLGTKEEKVQKGGGRGEMAKKDKQRTTAKDIPSRGTVEELACHKRRFEI